MFTALAFAGRVAFGIAVIGRWFGVRQRTARQERTTMRSRPGFARLRPLVAATALAAGAIILLPFATVTHCRTVRAGRPVAGFFEVLAPVPAHDIVDANGQRWELADIPGHHLQGLYLSGAEWAGIDLHDACFIGCNFHSCDLRGANLRRAAFIDCDMGDANLDRADVRESAAWWTKPIPGGSPSVWR